jgi:hypothetical protein
MPFGKSLSCDRDGVRRLVARERIDDRFGIVCAPKISPEAQRRIRRQQLVFDRLSEDCAEGPGDAADG